MCDLSDVCLLACSFFGEHISSFLLILLKSVCVVAELYLGELGENNHIRPGEEIFGWHGRMKCGFVPLLNKV